MVNAHGKAYEDGWKVGDRSLGNAAVGNRESGKISEKGGVIGNTVEKAPGTEGIEEVRRL